MLPISISASYEDAISKYAWFKFTGSRGKEVTQRTHKRMIRDGDVFGILPLRNGSRFTLIFPDMPHVDFPLDKTTGMSLMERSSKLRKVPEVVQRGREKVSGAVTIQKRLNRTNFDVPRYSPKGVKSEVKAGLNFGNYQWRIVPNNDYPVKTSKGVVKFYKNDMIGVRFLRAGKGGVVVNTDGMFIKVDDVQFDQLVHDTNIMPLGDWPKGEVPSDAVAAYRKQARRARYRNKIADSEAERLARNAAILEQQQQRKELRKQRNKEEAERSQEMTQLRKKVKRGEVEMPKPEVRTVYEDDPELRGRKKARVIEVEDLEEDLEEIDLDFDEQKLQEVLTRSPFSGDAFNIEDSIGTLFGDDDDSDEIEGDTDLDLSDIEEPEDDEEEDTPPPKVRAKAVKGKKPVEEDPAEDEEDTDVEEDFDDSDPDGADEGDDSGDTDDESMDESDDDEGADPESEDEPDEDADTSDAVDETEEEDSSDDDVTRAEKEAAITAKKIAADNKSTPGKRADEAEEGDVLRFRADTKLQRDWLIVKVSSHTASDNIVIYTLYDLTNSPDEVRQVRINRARKQNLFDYAEHVKDMAPKLFNRVYDLVEDYPVNKDPIAS